MTRNDASATETAGSNGNMGYLAGELPALPDFEPTNLALVYVGEDVYEAWRAMFRAIENRDVVLIARGPILASHAAKRFNGRVHRLWVLDGLDTAARTAYFRWLSDLAAKHEQVTVLVLVVDVNRDSSDPDPGEWPFLGYAEPTLQQALESVPSIRTESYFDYDSGVPGLSANLRHIPLDEVHLRPQMTTPNEEEIVL
jgi:hypothetical protein